MVGLRGGFAWWVCVVGLRGGFAWWVCVVGLRGGFAWWVCVVGLRGGFAWWVCVVGLRGGFEWWVCVVAESRQTNSSTPVAIVCCKFAATHPPWALEAELGYGTSLAMVQAAEVCRRRV